MDLAIGIAVGSTFRLVRLLFFSQAGSVVFPWLKWLNV
jgi:hypothetical protein